MVDISLISLVNVSRQYPIGDEKTTVLKEINLTIAVARWSPSLAHPGPANLH